MVPVWSYLPILCLSQHAPIILYKYKTIVGINTQSILGYLLSSISSQLKIRQNIKVIIKVRIFHLFINLYGRNQEWQVTMSSGTKKATFSVLWLLDFFFNFCHWPSGDVSKDKFWDHQYCKHFISCNWLYHQILTTMRQECIPHTNLHCSQSFNDSSIVSHN